MSTELKQTFDNAVKAMNEYSGPALSNDQKLKAYAYFKQAEKGKCTADRPGIFELVARAKHDAWVELGDMSSEEAMKFYIELVSSIVGGL